MSNPASNQEMKMSEQTKICAIDKRARALAQWLDAQAARDSNDDEAAWRLKPCRR
jgi:hypothetical protein